VSGKAVAVGFTVCMVLVAAVFVAGLYITKTNLNLLSQVPPLSYATVALVWSYVASISFLIWLALVGILLVLVIVEVALLQSRR